MTERWTLAGLLACGLTLVLLTAQGVSFALGQEGPPVFIPETIALFAVIYFVLLVLLLPALPRPAPVSVTEYLLRLLASGLFTILAFGALFYAAGITKGTPLTDLYFSMVTFSTLGYGDYAPNTDLFRLIAATLAIIGNLHLGLFVAAVFYLLQTRLTDPPTGTSKEYPDPDQDGH